MKNPEVAKKARLEQEQHRSKLLAQEASSRLEVPDSKLQELEERLLCVVCQTSQRQVLIEKCKHMPFCKECAESCAKQAEANGHVKECPLCRVEYAKTI